MRRRAHEAGRVDSAADGLLTALHDAEDIAHG
nr:MAG TPA: hypothetical protein [Caudoviricetes sp.]